MTDTRDVRALAERICDRTWALTGTGVAVSDLRHLATALLAADTRAVALEKERDHLATEANRLQDHVNECDEWLKEARARATEAERDKLAVINERDEVIRAEHKKRTEYLARIADLEQQLAEARAEIAQRDADMRLREAWHNEVHDKNEQRIATLTAALGQASRDLRRVGNDYPGSSCHLWCHTRADAADLALLGLDAALTGEPEAGQ